MDLHEDAWQRLNWALDELNADTRSREKVSKAFADEKLIVMTEEDYHQLLALADGR